MWNWLKKGENQGTVDHNMAQQGKHKVVPTASQNVHYYANNLVVSVLFARLPVAFSRCPTAYCTLCSGAAAQCYKYAYLKMDSLFILVAGMLCNRSHYFFCQTDECNYSSQYIFPCQSEFYGCEDNECRPED